MWRDDVITNEPQVSFYSRPGSEISDRSSSAQDVPIWDLFAPFTEHLHGVMKLSSVNSDCIVLDLFSHRFTRVVDRKSLDYI